MKRVRLLRKSVVLCLVLVVFSSAMGLAASSSSSRIEESIKVLKEMAEQSDAESMAYLLGQAKGVAIFPSVIKAGLMVGGRYGEGLVLRRDSDTGLWYGPDFVQIKGLSYGLQIGVQSTSLILVIANERGMDSFKGDKITLGGDLSVAAGPVGRHAEAGTDLNLKASIYSYSMSKGIFAGMSLEGAAITTDGMANDAYWGKSLLPDDILNERASGSKISPLLDELNTLIQRGDWPF